MIETAADALNDHEWVADSLGDIVWQILAIAVLSEYVLDLTEPSLLEADAIP